MVRVLLGKDASVNVPTLQLKSIVVLVSPPAMCKMKR